MKEILIIDHSEEFCAELSHELGQIGHSALCSYTLGDGLRKLASSSIGLVMLNSPMPDGGAIDLIAKIRQGSRLLKS